MNEFNIYPEAIISILGIAYPILLQVVSGLEDKYKSSKVVPLFDSKTFFLVKSQ
jgi:hypothetical protein